MAAGLFLDESIRYLDRELEAIDEDEKVNQPPRKRPQIGIEDEDEIWIEDGDKK